MTTRKTRIRRLKVLLKTKTDGVGNKTVIAKFMLEEGISLRKIREYLKVLKLAGEIEEEITI